MFVVQFENITCHWKFSAYRAGLQLVKQKTLSSFCHVASKATSSA
jgi:hypothetical protein